MQRAVKKPAGARIFKSKSEISFRITEGLRARLGVAVSNETLVGEGSGAWRLTTELPGELLLAGTGKRPAKEPSQRAGT